MILCFAPKNPENAHFVPALHFDWEQRFEVMDAAASLARAANVRARIIPDNPDQGVVCDLNERGGVSRARGIIMSQVFAKLYERNGRQVVVTREPWGDDNKPSVVIAFELSFGVARTALEFRANKAGEALRDKAFVALDEAAVFGAVDKFLEALP